MKYTEIHSHTSDFLLCILFLCMLSNHSLQKFGIVEEFQHGIRAQRINSLWYSLNFLVHFFLVRSRESSKFHLCSFLILALYFSSKSWSRVFDCLIENSIIGPWDLGFFNCLIVVSVFLGLFDWYSSEIDSCDQEGSWLTWFKAIVFGFHCFGFLCVENGWCCF